MVVNETPKTEDKMVSTWYSCKKDFAIRSTLNTVLMAALKSVFKTICVTLSCSALVALLIADFKTGVRRVSILPSIGTSFCEMLW